MQRSALYGLLYLILTTFLMFGVLGGGQLVKNYLNISGVPVLLIVAFITVLLYEPLKLLLMRITNALFLIEDEKRSKILNKWTIATTAAIDQPMLIEQVAGMLHDDQGITATCIYVRSGDAFAFKKVYDQSQWQLSDAVDDETSWLSLLRQYGRVVAIDIDQLESDVARSPMIRYWSGLGVEMVIPLRFNDDWEGVLLLGEKKSQQNYTFDDKLYFETLSAQLAAALAHQRMRTHMLTQERLAALGVMSAGIAHEIRNPMVSIKAFSQLLPTKYGDPVYRQKFEQIVLPQLNRIEDLVTALLHAGRPRKPSRMLVDANEVLRDVVVLCEPERKNHNCDIQFSAGKPVVIYADRSQMTQVFLNLTRNALQAMRDAGTLSISASAVSDDWAEVEFKDTGMGMTKQELEHLFDPFFTTKQEGTGLGLSISYRIIEEHGGKIILDSVPKLGTTFKLRLPRNPVASSQTRDKVYIRPTSTSI